MFHAIAPVLLAALSIFQPGEQPANPAAPLEAPIAADDAALAARLLADLKAIPAKRAALGDAEHRQGLLTTEKWLIDRLLSMGLTVKPHEFVWNSPALKALIIPKDAPPAEKPADDPPKDDPRFRFRNYIVDLPGTDLAAEVLILGAHYDAVPLSPGADDNATGVAALLEIARTLKDTPRRRTIRLVFFTLEEVGLHGSVQYVLSKRADWFPASAPTPAPAAGDTPATPTPPKEKLVGMVSLECLGWFSDAAGSQTNPIPKVAGVPVLNLKVPDAGNFIGLAGISKHREFSQRLIKEMQAAEPDLPILAADLLPIAPPDFLRSDHAPFLLAGLPAVMLTDTANFRNPNYHKPTDTPDTIDMPRFSKVVRAVTAAARAIAEMPVETPAETPAKAKGNLPASPPVSLPVVPPAPGR
jgi:hypothetical protein